MIEQIEEYLFIAVLFFLAFCGGVVLFEGFKKPLRSFLKKISWNTISKVLCAWAIILFLKKVVYYVPLQDIMQTPSSIWWADRMGLGMLYFVFLIILILAGIIGNLLGLIVLPPGALKRGWTLAINSGWVALVFVMAGFLRGFTLAKFIFTPVLVLKLLCSGKYPGLFTSLAAGYFMVDRYQQLKPKITRNNVKSLILPGLLLLGFLVFSLFYFPGDKEAILQGKAEAARSQRDFEDLMDVVQPMKDHFEKSRTLRQIALAINKTGNRQKAKEFLQEASREAGQIIKIIFKAAALRETALAAVELEDLKWARRMFQQATRATEELEDIMQKSTALKDIALAIARIGDFQWATTVARSIPAYNIKNNTLKEIKKIEEERKND